MEINEYLDISNLTRKFGRTEALKGIDINIREPGVYGFLGPNGAGKTTTFKIICNLLNPTSGSVRVCGIDLSERPVEAMSRIGVQFDAPAFYPYLTGRENLILRERYLGKQHSGRIDSLLRLSGLGDAAERRVKEYSWGMKQRLSLAGALLPDPSLLLLDEPTNGLDPAGIAYIRELIPSLAHGEGRAVLLSSHRMDEIQQICDRLIIINDGKIIISGTESELRIIEIEISNPDGAADIIEGLDEVLDLARRGEKRVEIIAPGLDPDNLKTYLQKNGIHLDNAVEKEFNLEEVFLRLTASERE